MRRFGAWWVLAVMVGLLAGAASAAEQTYGWRGNWTGLYPEAEAPVQWGRIAKGVVARMTCQAAKPADGAAKSGQLLVDSFMRDWLVIGPIVVGDTIGDFAEEQIAGEAGLSPAEGEKAGELAWKRMEAKKGTDLERWGMVELDWIDVGKAVEGKPNSVAYAHTYLHCARAGKVRLVVDHYIGLKMWVNGEMVYASAKEASGYGSHYAISRQKLALVNYHSPEVELNLKEGWNRVLVKVSNPKDPAWKGMKFAHRLFDVEPVTYEEKNIAWMTRMPERTNACPVVVGERIFTPAEPDELLCLDKATGKVLWRRFNGFYEATPETERAANPAFKEQVEPLAKELAATMDYEKGLEIRRKMREALVGIDKAKYTMKLEGHLEGHFGIVGFTTTPVSDGKHVWAFYGQGVAACYDMEGNRKWIVRLPCDKQVSYSCAPAVIGDRMVCVFAGIRGLDARTGEQKWHHEKIGGIASLIPATVKGTDIVTTKSGQFFRVSDGKLLWSNPNITSSDAGWAPGVFVGDTFYLLWCGVNSVSIGDFSQVEGDEWKPKWRGVGLSVNNRRPNGEWLDRWTAGSPVIWEGVLYCIDQYGVFYALDLKTEKTLYRQDMGFDELHNYNAIGVGASAALGGKNIYVMDNQGMCVVLKTGGEYAPVAVNRIETIVQRNWPVNPQEIVANGPPVFEGKRMYIRGEQYMYCIGEK